MARVRVEELLGAPVSLHGIELGRTVDVILDKDRRRALGLEIHCGDEARRFLPLSAMRFGEMGIELVSPFVMLEASELAFYTQRGSTVSALRHAEVEVGGELAGRLADVVLEPDGVIAEIVVDTGAGRKGVRYGPTVVIASERRRIRAAS